MFYVDKQINLVATWVLLLSATGCGIMLTSFNALRGVGWVGAEYRDDTHLKQFLTLFDVLYG